MEDLGRHHHHLHDFIHVCMNNDLKYVCSTLVDKGQLILSYDHMNEQLIRTYLHLRSWVLVTSRRYLNDDLNACTSARQRQVDRNNATSEEISSAR